MRRAPQAGERVQERALSDDAADRAAPVSDEQAALEVGAGDEGFNRAAQVADVAQSRRQRGGQKWRFPTRQEDGGIGSGEFFREGGGA